MKKAALVILSLCSMTACRTNPAALAQDSNATEYQIQDNEFAVMIVMEEGMSEAEAKKKALQRAAVITRKNNYRYFVVEKEERVEVPNASNPTDGNPPAPESGAYPAYPLTFICYQDRPSEDAFDSCTLSDCRKKP